MLKWEKLSSKTDSNEKYVLKKVSDPHPCKNEVSYFTFIEFDEGTRIVMACFEGSVKIYDLNMNPIRTLCDTG